MVKWLRPFKLYHPGFELHQKVIEINVTIAGFWVSSMVSSIDFNDANVLVAQEEHWPPVLFICLLTLKMSTGGVRAELAII